MRSQGFEYEILPYSRADNDPMGADLLDGISDTDFADSWGFGVGNWPDALIAEEGSEPVLRGEPVTESLDGATAVAYQEALTGTSAEDPGCIDLADSLLASLDGNYDDIADEVLVLQESFGQSEAVAICYADWAECMTDEGYSEYLSPLDAANTHLRLIESGNGPTFDEEREVAMATVRCGGTVIDLLPDDLLPQWSTHVDRYS